MCLRNLRTAPYIDSITLLFGFDLILEARVEILEKISLVFWKKFWHQKDILNLSDLLKSESRTLFWAIAINRKNKDGTLWMPSSFRWVSVGICKYTRSSRNAQFGSWKKPCYAKIALVGMYCMIQLTRNSPTNTYIAQKTALRENRVMRNRVMRGLGVI